MKKTLLITFLIILTFGLTACLDQTSQVYTPVDTETPTDDDIIVDQDDQKDSEDNDLSNSEHEQADIDDDSDETELDDSDEEETADADETQPAQSENIIVETPLPSSTVTSPFEISGQARVFEGTILVRVKNQDGKIVIPTQIVTAHGADAGEFGDWKIKVNYQFYATKEGIIEVFSESAKDGSEINMVEVPVKFE